MQLPPNFLQKKKKNQIKSNQTQKPAIYIKDHPKWGGEGLKGLTELSIHKKDEETTKGLLEPNPGYFMGGARA